MKRKDAFRKLRTICQRLDEVDTNDFYVVPVRLYLFGSVLTNKPKPTNLNLFLEYREQPNLDEDEVLDRLMSGKALPHQQAVTHLRRGMQMVRFSTKSKGVDSWLRNWVWPEDIQVRLVWQPELNWQPIVDALEVQPLPWNEAKDKRFKEINAHASQIERDQGRSAALEWAKGQIESYRDSLSCQ